ncbi:MAG: CPXCG motif-containing cysteine-rich protein [Myxococcaceae bacterium]
MISEDEVEEDALGDGAVGAQCPYCGEGVELTVDPVGASSEQYTEDCSVCCRPWTVFVTRDEDAGLSVTLGREDD